jgi:hypothetical protein
MYRQLVNLAPAGDCLPPHRYSIYEERPGTLPIFGEGEIMHFEYRLKGYRRRERSYGASKSEV